MYSKEAYPHLVEVLQITSEVLLIWETFLVERGRIMTCFYFPNENPVSSSYALHLMTALHCERLLKIFQFGLSSSTVSQSVRRKL